MILGEKLKQARLSHFTQMKRPAVAEALSQRCQWRIEPNVIRQLETGMSSRWLYSYFVWAIDVLQYVPTPDDYAELSRNTLESAAYGTLAQFAPKPAPTRVLSIWEPSDSTSTDNGSEVYSPGTDTVRCPLELASGNSFFVVDGRAVVSQLELPEESLIIFQVLEGWHEGALVLTSTPHGPILRIQAIENRKFCLALPTLEKTIDNELKIPDTKVIGMAVGVLAPYKKSMPLTSNIAWNDGQILTFLSR